jgi:hypothetical protein
MHDDNADESTLSTTYSSTKSEIVCLGVLSREENGSFILKWASESETSSKNLLCVGRKNNFKKSFLENA